MRLLPVFAALFVTVSTAALAALVTYEDRSAFIDAANDLASEDFEGFPEDEGDRDFDDISSVISDFELQIEKLAGRNVPPGFNVVEVPPYQSPSNSPSMQNAPPDDSAYVLVGLIKDNQGGDIFSILFDFPVYEFAADLTKVNDAYVRSDITFLDENGGVVGQYRPLSEGGDGSTRFFGFISDTPFQTVSFTAINRSFSEGFGLDNVLYTKPAEIPVPASLPLLATGIALFGVLRGRKAS